MQIVTNPDSFREQIKNYLCKYFQDTKTASNLEKGIYNWTIKQANSKQVVKKWDNPFFVQIYKDKFKTVVSNLNNTTLIEQVTNNEIKVHQIAFMSHYEMKPEKWAAIIETQMKINNSKYETQVEASTDMFTCRKCKGNRCTYVQAQLKSADEPMTTFVTCLDCGKRWKC